MDPATEDTLRQALQRAMDTAAVEMVDGRKQYVLSCRSGQLRMQLGFLHYRQAPVKVAAAEGGGEAPETRAVGAIAAPAEGVYRLEGVASSTSQDWYGTEMSPKCLEGMSLQFGRGVGVFPSHGSWIEGLGWDDEMGKTISAELERAPVAAPADATEPGYLLRCIMDMDMQEESCKKLKTRLERGQEIGLSIGGYFIQVRYIMSPDDEYEIERIIVEEVELDHLAVVRNPANPDSMGLKLLRSVPTEAIRSKRPAPAARSTDDGAPAPAATPAPEAAASEPTSEPAPESSGTAAAGASSTEDSSAASTSSASEDASRSIPASPTEIPMTQEEIDAMIQRAVAKALEARAAATPAPAAAAASAPEGETVEALRTKLAQEQTRAANLEKSLNHLNAGGVRSGSGGVRTHSTNDGGLNRSALGKLVTRAKTEGKAPLLVRVIAGDAERGITGIQDLLDVNLRSRDGAGAIKLREAKDAAPDMLRDIFDAAYEDGTVHDWQRAA